MIRLLRHPLTWLLVLAAVVSIVLAASGRLVPERVADSKSYIDASRTTSLADALARYRTVGYPLLLRFAATDGNSFPTRWVWVPPIQLAAYLAAMVLWWVAARRFTGSRWLAFAAAAPLAWVPVMELVAIVQPDFLAAAFVVAALALLLLLVKSPAVPWLWAGLATALFCSYQLRPAGAFLVGLVPVLGGLLALLVTRASMRRALRLAAGLAVLTATPYLLFGGLRWLTVGHFGLVSFAGSNLAGMASCFVDSELVAELKPEHQWLARRILRMRERRGWRPLTLADPPEPWFEQYSDNIWDIARQAVKAQHRAELLAWERAGAPYPDPRPTQVIWDERLAAFGTAVIGLRPRLHLHWILGAVRYGLRQLARDLWIVWPAVALALGLPALGLRRRPPPPELRPVAGLLLVATAYLAAYLLLVSLLSFPFERYFHSISLLLPGALCAAALAVWRQVLLAPRGRPT